MVQENAEMFSEIILGNSEEPSEESLFSLSEDHCHNTSNTVFPCTFDKVNREGHPFKTNVAAFLVNGNF